MKQETFRDRAETRWLETETLIGKLDRRKTEGTEKFPALYRQLCHDLAIARDRQFDVSLVERLNRLALRGHQHLYRSRRFSLRRFGIFFKYLFPHAVRRELKLVLFALMLVFGSMFLFAFLVQHHPALIYSVVPLEQVHKIEAMYNPDSEHFYKPINNESRFAIFGYYILNNIGISLRVFAGGILFGVGSILVLLYNGVFIGTITGHIIRIGYGNNFFAFIINHSALELLAITLSGVSGLKLGWSLIAPGRLTRGESLRRTARRAVPLLYGSTIMLILAAIIEAFWSPYSLPYLIKYGFGITWWVALLFYFIFSGRKYGV